MGHGEQRLAIGRTLLSPPPPRPHLVTTASWGGEGRLQVTGIGFLRGTPPTISGALTEEVYPPRPKARKDCTHGHLSDAQLNWKLPMPAGSRELEDSQAVYPPHPYDPLGPEQGDDRHPFHPWHKGRG